MAHSYGARSVAISMTSRARCVLAQESIAIPAFVLCVYTCCVVCMHAASCYLWLYASTLSATRVQWT